MRAESYHALIPVALGAGLLLSIYAGYETTHPALQGSCSFSALFSCAKVDQSAHTTTLGIPDYVIGIAGYVAMIVVDVFLYRSWHRSWLNAFLLLSGLGIAVSAYFAYVEAFEIGAFCPVCLSAYAANGIAFLAATMLWFEGRDSDRAAPSGGPGPSAPT